MDNLQSFHKDLTVLVNKYKINLTDIPDFLVSEYLINCLVTLNQMMLKDRQIKDQESKILIV